MLSARSGQETRIPGLSGAAGHLRIGDARSGEGAHVVWGEAADGTGRGPGFGCFRPRDEASPRFPVIIRV